ncbi:MAG: acylphosphatase, partial [Terriglobia bacterium]
QKPCTRCRGRKSLAAFGGCLPAEAPVESLARAMAEKKKVEWVRRYLVSGFVQGVGFRFFVERVARQLSVGGYVKNLRDGRVEVYAIGAPAQLRELKQRLGEGPRGARVRSVEEEEAPLVERYRRQFSLEFEGDLW